MSPVLAGRFLTTVLPGKSRFEKIFFFFEKIFLMTCHKVNYLENLT